ncbi:DNA-binding transcriptional regulator YciT [uncultured Cedecea sp.]|uniref:DeoR/GlpR family DNA-binding transcription regulator n=1 Tax=uncultured Cedecea sp. TaxID=988762 RepID=UPI00262C44A4|nr:DNA-binding transcriptional regulator YciT [uncultured Cedecea sp.]
MNSRHQQIIHLVNLRGNISVSELARQTGVSEVTVRQDLNLLEKESYLRRTHGSAVALDSDDVGARMQTRYPLKQVIATRAATLVNDGESVFIEGGSTCALLARTLADRRGLTIITVSHYIAHLLKDSACEVVVLGGLYQKESASVVGPLTRFSLQHIHFHKAFIGIDGWHENTGFTGRNMLRSDVINALMEKEGEKIVLTDSSKFGQVHPYPLSPEIPFSHIITDDGLASEYQRVINKQGILLTKVSETHG